MALGTPRTFEAAASASFKEACSGPAARLSSAASVVLACGQRCPWAGAAPCPVLNVRFCFGLIPTSVPCLGLGARKRLTPPRGTRTLTCIFLL